MVLTSPWRWQAQRRAWHQNVHRRLGEELHYYLVRVRPFDVSTVANRFRTLVDSEHVGSLRVFQISGPFDIVVRAWLHPTIANKFQARLQSHLEGCEIIYHFGVLNTVRRWYWKYDKPLGDEALLSTLNDESAIRDIEKEGPGAEFSETNLIIKRDPQTDITVKFFLAITVLRDHATPRNIQTVVESIENYLLDHQEFQYISLYTGFDNFQVLIKGQVPSSDYFCIGKLADHVRISGRPLGASTDTLLVTRPDEIHSHEQIGKSTFLAIKGKNLLAQSLIPELYDDHHPEAESIELFLKEHLQRGRPSQHYKTFIRDYFLGLIYEDEGAMLTAIFKCLTPIEKYLRESHPQFVGKFQGRLSLKDVYREAEARATKRGEQVTTGSKHLSLGVLFDIYAIAIEKVPERPDIQRLTADWQDLVSVRNRVAHASLDGLMKAWKEPMATILRHMRRIDELVELIAGVTGCRFLERRKQDQVRVVDKKSPPEDKLE